MEDNRGACGEYGKMDLNYLTANLRLKICYEKEGIRKIKGKKLKRILVR
jgi:hypothetical protein